jgi:hypothetical protein
VPLGADLVHLNRHWLVEDNANLANTKLIIDDLCTDDEVKEFLEGHKLLLSTDGIPPRVLGIDVLKGLHIALYRNIAGLILKLQSEIRRVKSVEVGHYVLLKGLQNRFLARLYYLS